ncbi:MAG TPA: hypothetical protein V6C63_05100 [Allocoleopsis sp.]
MNSSSSAVHRNESTRVRVLGETGQTVVYVFPSGGAQLLRDNEGEFSDRPSLSQSRKLLGEQLIEAGYITAAQRDVALHDQKSTGLRLGEILLMRGWLDEATLNTFL